MRVHIFKLVGVGAMSASLLAACGGGGGDAPATPRTPTTTAFALKAGYQARIVNGTNDNFNLSGSCNGTATITIDRAIASTFEGVPGYGSAQVSTVNFTNCQPASNSATGTTYYNANYVPIGLSIRGEYSKFATPPSDLPTTVKVGDTGIISTLTTYSDSTKAVVTGKREVSYAIEDDTSTTAIANIITKGYDLSNQLLSTEQSRYHMAEGGGLTLASIDVQFSTTSTIHLVYTPR